MTRYISIGKEDIQKTKMENQVFETSTLLHQVVHEDLEMFPL